VLVDVVLLRDLEVHWLVLKATLLVQVLKIVVSPQIMDLLVPVVLDASVVLLFAVQDDLKCGKSRLVDKHDILDLMDGEWERHLRPLSVLLQHVFEVDSLMLILDGGSLLSAFCFFRNKPLFELRKFKIVHLVLFISTHIF
jgi:hypothetical protein